MMRKKGQQVSEYAVIVAVAVAAFSAMVAYVQRGIQSQVREIDRQAVGINDTREQ